MENISTVCNDSIANDFFFNCLLFMLYRVLIGIIISSLSPICGNFLLYVLTVYMFSVNNYVLVVYKPLI